MASWQPVETVQKDGTMVLTWHDYGTIVQNQTHMHYGQSGYVCPQKFPFMSPLLECGNVTHWMPLPEPPNG